MAITRHTQMNNARVLRSRRVTVAPVDPWSRHGCRSYRRPLKIPQGSIRKQQRQPNPSDWLKENLPTPYQRHVLETSFTSSSVLVLGRIDNGDIDFSIMFDDKPSLPAPNLGSLPSPAVRWLPSVASFEDVVSSSEKSPLLDPATTLRGCLSSVSEDIGLPSDGLWDYDAAYEERYCFEHGGFEYLLTTPDRWISSKDLKTSAAEARLGKITSEA